MPRKPLLLPLCTLVTCCLALLPHTLGGEPGRSILDSQRMSGAPLHPSPTAPAGQPNGHRSPGPRTCPPSWSILGMPASSSACAARCAWKLRSSISMTRGKRPSRLRWLSPRASSPSGILAPAASSLPPTFLMALSTSHTPTGALHGIP